MSSTAVRRTLAILAVATVLWTGSATSALAHSGLVSSNPADGSVVTQAPASISLTFNEPLLPDANSISLNSADGTNVVSAQVEPSGDTVEIAWPADLAAGEYQAAFRVVSADGHPVTGAVSFTYAPGDAVAPGSAESNGSAVAISETAEPESRGGTPWLGLGIAVVIGLVLVVLFAAMRRRRA